MYLTLWSGPSLGRCKLMRPHRRFRVPHGECEWTEGDSPVPPPRKVIANGPTEGAPLSRPPGRWLWTDQGGIPCPVPLEGDREWTEGAPLSLPPRGWLQTDRPRGLPCPVPLGKWSRTDRGGSPVLPPGRWSQTDQSRGPPLPLTRTGTALVLMHEKQ